MAAHTAETEFAACSNRQCPDRPNCRRGQLADNAPVEVWLLLNHFNRNATPQLGFDCFTPRTKS